MGVEAFLISSSLEAVLAQRLLRRICPHCKVPAPVSQLVRDKLEAFGGGRVDGVFYQGAGCEECRGLGYRGRTGIYELLPITAELREIIVRTKSSAEIKAAAHRNMITLQQDALRKATEGITTLDEVLRVTSGDLKE
jgi:type II secretory ATPase GspE/PulE/Tfp pilus assembly ATPase PilB-like protein